jgi:hypothetical protein
MKKLPFSKKSSKKEKVVKGGKMEKSCNQAQLLDKID